MRDQADRSWTRKVWSKVSTAILRAVVDRTSDDALISIVQAKWLGDRVSADVEYKQPQGLYFRPVSGAEGLYLAVAGNTSSGVLIAAQSRDDSPGGGGIAEGEGGMYYAGEFKVFLDSSGLVHLGAKSGADYVALAAKVKTDLDAIKSFLDEIKTAFNTHAHTGNLGNPTGTPVTPPAVPLTILSTYTTQDPAATKVKAT